VEVAEHIDALRREGILLADAAALAGADAPVPSCPGWVVRELVRHQGGVHRWATAIVSGPRREAWRVDLDEVVGRWPQDDDLVTWFTDGHRALLDALASADPDLDCWAFLAASSPLAMWARRQAHETAIHRVDAQLASGATPTRAPAPFAADGVDELLTCFITRPGGRLRCDVPQRLAITSIDTPGRWLLEIDPEGVQTQIPKGAVDADCVIGGAAADLYLTLWNRSGADGLHVEGDRRLLDLFLDRVHVRWS
jgi:uncharacterized protein (TIGR03083 family)